MKEEHFNLQEQLSEGLELKNWVLREGLKKVEVEVEVKFSTQGGGWRSVRVIFHFTFQIFFPPSLQSLLDNDIVHV